MTVMQEVYYLANAIGPMTHDHWAGENCLHWVMDMIFRDDECSVRTEKSDNSKTALGDPAAVRTSHPGVWRLWLALMRSPGS